MSIIRLKSIWQWICLSLILTFSSATLISASLPPIIIPVTAQPSARQAAAAPTTRTLAEFIQSVTNGNPADLVGVYSPFTFALPITEQPAGKPGYVADEDGLATRFQLASDAGSIGLLAHYQRSGKAFTELTPGQEITLIYGDGSTRSYQVQTFITVQAIEPEEALTEFVSMDETQTRYSQEALFDLVYRQADRLVLQTCLTGQGSKTWGRVFIIAEPVSS